jgi:hypothetical protein
MPPAKTFCSYFSNIDNIIRKARISILDAPIAPQDFTQGETLPLAFAPEWKSPAPTMPNLPFPIVRVHPLGIVSFRPPAAVPVDLQTGRVGFVHFARSFMDKRRKRRYSFCLIDMDHEVKLPWQ